MMTEFTLESLSEQFELLVAGLQNQKASAEERVVILRRMRALIDAADQLVLNDELHPELGEGLAGNTAKPVFLAHWADARVHIPWSDLREYSSTCRGNSRFWKCPSKKPQQTKNVEESCCECEFFSSMPIEQFLSTHLAGRPNEVCVLAASRTWRCLLTGHPNSLTSY